MGTLGYVAGGPEKWIGRANNFLADPKKTAVKLYTVHNVTISLNSEGLPLYTKLPS